jgi:hypothetical protein
MPDDTLVSKSSLLAVANIIRLLKKYTYKTHQYIADAVSNIIGTASLEMWIEWSTRDQRFEVDILTEYAPLLIEIVTKLTMADHIRVTIINDVMDLIDILQHPSVMGLGLGLGSEPRVIQHPSTPFEIVPSQMVSTTPTLTAFDVVTDENQSVHITAINGYPVHQITSQTPPAPPIPVIDTTDIAADFTVVDTPKDTSDVAVVDTPGDTPDVAVVDTPEDTPDVAVVDTPGDTSDVAVVDTPGDTPDVAVVDTPGDTSDVTVVDTPKDTSDVAVVDTPGDTPDVAVVDTPKDTSDVAIVETLSSAIVDTSDVAVIDTPGDTPVDTSDVAIVETLSSAIVDTSVDVATPATAPVTPDMSQHTQVSRVGCITFDSIFSIKPSDSRISVFSGSTSTVYISHHHGNIKFTFIPTGVPQCSINKVNLESFKYIESSEQDSWIMYTTLPGSDIRHGFLVYYGMPNNVFVYQHWDNGKLTDLYHWIL